MHGRKNGHTGTSPRRHSNVIFTAPMNTTKNTLESDSISLPSTLVGVAQPAMQTAPNMNDSTPDGQFVCAAQGLDRALGSSNSSSTSFCSNVSESQDEKLAGITSDSDASTQGTPTTNRGHVDGFSPLLNKNRTHSRASTVSITGSNDPVPVGKQPVQTSTIITNSTVARGVKTSNRQMSLASLDNQPSSDVQAQASLE